MSEKYELLIIGAGPFGLSMAAYCEGEGIEYKIVGRHMEFWKNNMPEGMCLRSGYDWHLDPFDVHTFEKFMESKGLLKKDFKPVPLDLYIDYTNWFTKQKKIEVEDSFVTKLYHDEENGLFEAQLEDGKTLVSKNVLLAVGFKYFKNIPLNIKEIIPQDRFFHTCNLRKLDKFKDSKCLVIGGRMSAFESAALLSEAGCKKVYISYRHDTPEFTESDWDWVMPMLDKIVDDPKWFRTLSSSERKNINDRFYTEGRLKMEPWLKDRLNKDSITFLPNTEISDCAELEDKSLEIILNNKQKIVVDHVLLATGYKVEMTKVPFIKEGNVLENLNLEDGYPSLDENLQTNIPGLFVTSMVATRDFGSFFGFTVSVNASSRIVGNYLRQF